MREENSYKAAGRGARFSLLLAFNRLMERASRLKPTSRERAGEHPPPAHSRPERALLGLVSVRHRWRTSTVLIIDRGDYAIVPPIPDDPIEALRGAYATPGPAADAVRAADRAAETASDDRRQGQAG